MQCPKCKLENPPGTLRCDCGYDFQTGSVKGSLLSEKEIKRNIKDPTPFQEITNQANYAASLGAIPAFGVALLLSVLFYLELTYSTRAHIYAPILLAIFLGASIYSASKGVWWPKVKLKPKIEYSPDLFNLEEYLISGDGEIVGKILFDSKTKRIRYAPDKERIDMYAMLFSRAIFGAFHLLSHDERVEILKWQNKKEKVWDRKSLMEFVGAFLYFIKDSGSSGTEYLKINEKVFPRVKYSYSPGVISLFGKISNINIDASMEWVPEIITNHNQN